MLKVLYGSSSNKDLSFYFQECNELIYNRTAFFTDEKSDLEKKGIHLQFKCIVYDNTACLLYFIF